MQAVSYQSNTIIVITENVPSEFLHVDVKSR